LRQAQKMEAIGQLTGGIAHDFNNLLTPIVGSLDLVRRRHRDDERSQRLIGSALRAAERAATLTHRLLSFARRQSLQPKAVDITMLVEGAAELLQRSLGPTIRIFLDLPIGLPTARVDPNQLELALLNLAINSRDAMPEGGELKLSVALRTVSAKNAIGNNA
jgi:signal transduction histidine kinase